jgi:capsular polysaccharide biosynthesis protein
MDSVDLLGAIWRHRLLAAATWVAVLAATAVFVAIQKPVYESTETVQLSTTDPAILSQVNTLTALYSALLTAQETKDLAQTEVGASLADLTVRTFTDSPIIKVDARSGSPDIAQRSAAAVVKAVVTRTGAGSPLGASNVSIVVVDGPSTPDKVWPRPALSLFVAGAVGLLLGMLVACLADLPRRRAAAEAFSRGGAVAVPAGSGDAGGVDLGRLVEVTPEAAVHTTPVARSARVRARGGTGAGKGKVTSVEDASAKVVALHAPDEALKRPSPTRRRRRQPP